MPSSHILGPLPGCGSEGDGVMESLVVRNPEAGRTVVGLWSAYGQGRGLKKTAGNRVKQGDGGGGGGPVSAHLY